ncbi:MAG: hypothetical protein GXO89_05610, partial [Chlorobi bacterium]|nr:hypothetical protein [Chlorobiota bacterium]
MMAAASFNSCTKQENLEQTKPTQNEEAKIVFEKVTAFLAKVNYIKENPMYKSGEEMALGEAIWNLTAGFNYENSVPDGTYDAFYVDSAFTDLEVSGGLVNLDDLVNVYAQIEAGANAIRNDAPFNEKANKFTFIDIKSNNGQSIELVSTTIVGKTGLGTDPDYPPFVDGADWRYGDEYGMCTDPLVEGDAAIELQDIINARRYLH